MVGAGKAAAKRQQYQPISGNTTVDTDSEFIDKPPIVEVTTTKDFRSRLQLVKVNNSFSNYNSYFFL